MARKRYTEEQIVRVLREAEQGRTTQKELCRKYGVSEQVFYRWKRKYDGVDVADAKPLRQPGAANTRLKRLLADKMLEVELMQELNRKKW